MHEIYDTASEDSGENLQRKEVIRLPKYTVTYEVRLCKRGTFEAEAPNQGLAEMEADLILEDTSYSDLFNAGTHWEDEAEVVSVRQKA